MRITDDVLKALQKGIDRVGSKSRFARQANVNVNTLRKYLNRGTATINDATWEKIYPLIESFLPKREVEIMYRSGVLKSDEKILLDAFAELPPEVQQKKLMEIIELATSFAKKSS